MNTILEITVLSKLPEKLLIAKHAQKGLHTLDAIQLACLLHIDSDLSFAVTDDDILKSLIKLEGINAISSNISSDFDTSIFQHK